MTLHSVSTDIPCEIWDKIIEDCGSTNFLSLLKCDKKFYNITLPKLYATVNITSPTAFTFYCLLWDRNFILPMIRDLAIGPTLGSGESIATRLVEPASFEHSTVWTAILHILPNCTRLTSMNFHHIGIPSGFASMLEALPTLVALLLVGCTITGDSTLDSCQLQLRQLELRELFWRGHRKDYYFACNCFRLQELTIEWWSGCEAENAEDFSLPSSLESLTILSLIPRWDYMDGVAGSNRRRKTSQGISRVLVRCHQLQMLSIGQHFPGVQTEFDILLPLVTDLRVTYDFLLTLPCSFNKLTHLSLTKNSLDLCLTDHNLPLFINVTFFDLNLPFWSASLFQYIPTCFPSLETLTVNWCDTMDPGEMVVTELPNILNLYHCIRKLSFTRPDDNEEHLCTDNAFASINLPEDLSEIRIARRVWKIKHSSELPSCPTKAELFN
ncbi:hypothetical protein BDP27DRAFT_1428833 [Rhodocollybia butyracea]|uniref:F-box domain-containing protein n=1 Tax=Rhodocollybia butyracea TaxID=206335 RepID=A0A9P5U0N6_9AGAR|nr:hypothetical protein BDP27DRAFT_1428833 [Rhodocollybia butyracea]